MVLFNSRVVPVLYVVSKEWSVLFAAGVLVREGVAQESDLEVPVSQAPRPRNLAWAPHQASDFFAWAPPQADPACGHSARSC